MQEVYEKTKANLSDKSHLLAASQHISTLHHKFQTNLQQNRLSLGQSRPIIPTNLSSKPQPEPQAPKISQIQSMKQAARKHYLQLTLQQNQLKRQSILSLSSLSPKKQRSIITSSDTETLTKLLAKQRKLQRKLAEKDEEIKQQEEEIKKEWRERQQQEVEERRRLQRESAEKNLQILKQRREQRRAELAEANRALKKLHDQQYLYLKAQQSAKHSQQTSYQTKLQQLHYLSQQNKQKIQQIRLHQQQYIESIRNRSPVSLSLSKSEYIKPPSNIYSEITRKEREESQRKKQERQEFPMRWKTRLEGYAEGVREKHREESVRKQATATAVVVVGVGGADTTRISLPEIKPLGRTQILQMGQKYFAESKKLISKRGRSLTTITPSQPPPAPSHKPRKHTDHLSSPFQPHFNSQRDQTQLKKVTALLQGDNNNNKLDKIKQAVCVAQKLQSSAGRNCQRLANSIQAKLLILKNIL